MAEEDKLGYDAEGLEDFGEYPEKLHVGQYTVCAREWDLEVCTLINDDDAILSRELLNISHQKGEMTMLPPRQYNPYFHAFSRSLVRA